MFTSLKKWSTYVLSLMLLGLMVVQPITPNLVSQVSVSTGTQVAQAASAKSALTSLALSFEANAGQTDPSVRFLAHGSGYTLFLTNQEAVMSIAAPHTTDKTGTQPAVSQPPTVLRYQWQGANTSAQVVGLNELPNKSNYYIGNNPAQWHTGVSNYARVEYKSIYPGINLAYYGKGGTTEYDFIVGPGADPSRIKMAITGADKVTLEAGSLVLHTALGDLRQPAPHIYQDGSNGRRDVAGNYQLLADGTVGFHVTAYDSNRALIIDPTMNYSTYLGGSGWDYGRSIAVDSSSNMYVTGQTASTNFPTASAYQGSNGGSWDAFITELNSSGSSLIYSTYFGGTNTDQGNGIVVDSSGRAYVTGQTQSNNFPTHCGLGYSSTGGDAFVLRLSSTGTLDFSTLLTGTGGSSGNSIALDSSSDMYVTGSAGTGFPTFNPIYTYGGNTDAFVTKLHWTSHTGCGFLLLTYSTYLGGSSFDKAMGIAIDSSGAAYVTGDTSSSNFPTVSSIYTFTASTDYFISKVNAAGTALTYSTYLGHTNYASDGIGGIAVDSKGSAYVTGSISNNSIPAVNAIQATNAGSVDAFITKLNAAGTAVSYSTYLGGTGDDRGNSIAVESSGTIVGIAYITGDTSSTNFPTVNPTQASNAGGDDAFVTKINTTPGTNWAFSTYLGGSGHDNAHGIAIYACNSICSTAVFVTGETLSTNFPTLSPYQTSNGGGEDGFITKITP